MTDKKKGRKPLNKSADYYKGYHTGFQRIARKHQGMAVVTNRKTDTKRGKDWQDGLHDGVNAANRRYFPNKRR
jgi:hypothetical protein